MAAQRTVRPLEPDAGYRAAVSPPVRRPGKKYSTVDLDQNGKGPSHLSEGQATKDKTNPRGCALGGTAPTGPEMGSWNGRRIFTVLQYTPSHAPKPTRDLPPCPPHHIAALDHTQNLTAHIRAAGPVLTKTPARDIVCSLATVPQAGLGL